MWPYVPLLSYAPLPRLRIQAFSWFIFRHSSLISFDYSTPLAEAVATDALENAPAVPARLSRLRRGPDRPVLRPLRTADRYAPHHPEAPLISRRAALRLACGQGNRTHLLADTHAPRPHHPGVFGPTCDRTLRQSSPAPPPRGSCGSLRPSPAQNRS